MKKHLILISVLALGLLASCNKTKEVLPVQIQLQLVCDGANFEVAGVPVSLQDAEATFTLESTTNASGAVSFSLKPGSYSATCTYVTAEDGQRLAYSGTSGSFLVVEETPATQNINLQKVESQQIVIKELYMAGCTNPDDNKGYTNDAYVILYNNSEVEADATDVVFGFLAPYNGHANNKYITDGKLSYENQEWVPAASAIWWFNNTVTIAPYSEVVVAIFGAINHSATVSTSVDLSNKDYYWMSNNGIAQYTNAKYAVADAIPQNHYLSCHPFSLGNSWVLSNSSPAFFIGRAPKANVEALCSDTENYDQTQGAGAANSVVKFPKANVIDAVEVWAAANVATSNARFPSDVNAGYVALTAKKGYTLYRNVDKDATEALEENKDKLVYNYSMGTVDVEGTTDPSGIDAEASKANGAHIIYKFTKNTTNDFHQRKQSSLKK